MKSVCISYNFSSRQLFDVYEPKSEKDVTKFLNRVAQDRTASPGSEIRAIRLYENGTTEALE
jgi:hypothetical protein